MSSDDIPEQPFDPAQKSINRTQLDNPRVMSAPFWGELRVFLAVAKAKSFSGAAEEMGVSTPTVSRQVRRLQDIIGSQLFVTTQNSIRLTPKGLELATVLSSLDERLYEISRDLAAENRDTEGYVRVSATEALAALFIAPAVSGFKSRYPGIRLHIQNPSHLINFKENNTDIMLSFVPGNGAIASEACGFIHFVPVASRSYVETYGMPTPDNLASHIFLDTEYYKGKTPVWAPWQKIVAEGTVAHDCDNSFAYGALIRAGQGIGLLASYALSESRLVPLDLGVRITLQIHLQAMQERLQSRPVRLVYEWLAEVFAPTAPWFGPKLNLADLPTHTVRPLIESLDLDTSGAG